MKLGMSRPARVVDMGVVPVSAESTESGEACNEGDAKAAGREAREDGSIL